MPATPYGPGGATLTLVNALIRLPEFLLGMAAGLAFAEGRRPNLDVRLPVALPVLLVPAHQSRLGVCRGVSFCFYLVHELVIVKCCPLHLRPGCGRRRSLWPARC